MFGNIYPHTLLPPWGNRLISVSIQDWSTEWQQYYPYIFSSLETCLSCLAGVKSPAELFALPCVARYMGRSGNAQCASTLSLKIISACLKSHLIFYTKVTRRRPWACIRVGLANAPGYNGSAIVCEHVSEWTLWYSTFTLLSPLPTKSELGNK